MEISIDTTPQPPTKNGHKRYAQSPLIASPPPKKPKIFEEEIFKLPSTFNIHDPSFDKLRQTANDSGQLDVLLSHSKGRYPGNFTSSPAQGNHASNQPITRRNLIQELSQTVGADLAPRIRSRAAHASYPVHQFIKPESRDMGYQRNDKRLEADRHAEAAAQVEAELALLAAESYRPESYLLATQSRTENIEGKQNLKEDTSQKPNRQKYEYYTDEEIYAAFHRPTRSKFPVKASFNGNELTLPKSLSNGIVEYDGEFELEEDYETAGFKKHQGKSKRKKNEDLEELNGMDCQTLGYGSTDIKDGNYKAAPAQSKALKSDLWESNPSHFRAPHAPNDSDDEKNGYISPREIEKTELTQKRQRRPNRVPKPRRESKEANQKQNQANTSQRQQKNQSNIAEQTTEAALGENDERLLQAEDDAHLEADKLEYEKLLHSLDIVGKKKRSSASIREKNKTKGSETSSPSWEEFRAKKSQERTGIGSANENGQNEEAEPRTTRSIRTGRTKMTGSNMPIDSTSGFLAAAEALLAESKDLFVDDEHNEPNTNSALASARRKAAEGSGRTTNNIKPKVALPISSEPSPAPKSTASTNINSAKSRTRRQQAQKEEDQISKLAAKYRANHLKRTAPKDDNINISETMETLPTATAAKEVIDNVWSPEQLLALQAALSSCDPSSSSYYKDLASRIKGKSANEVEYRLKHSRETSGKLDRRTKTASGDEVTAARGSEDATSPLRIDSKMSLLKNKKKLRNAILADEAGHEDDIFETRTYFQQQLVTPPTTNDNMPKSMTTSVNSSTKKADDADEEFRVEPTKAKKNAKQNSASKANKYPLEYEDNMLEAEESEESDEYLNSIIGTNRAHVDKIIHRVQNSSFHTAAPSTSSAKKSSITSFNQRKDAISIMKQAESRRSQAKERSDTFDEIAAEEGEDAAADLMDSSP